MLAPTRELAAQITAELAPLGAAVGVRVGVVYGGAPMPAQISALNRGLDVLVATPGRLIDLIRRDAVSLDGVKVVTVDEADRMADLGFLPPVEWLLRHIPADVQMLLFSATLDGAVARLTRRMTDPVLHTVEDANPTVDAMTHRFLQVHHMDKAKVVARIAAANGRTLVFCRTKRNCDRVRRDLVELGVRASAIHGDLPQHKRERALAQFTDGSRPVLGGDRRRRTWHPRRRRPGRRALRPARGPHRLPPPLRDGRRGPARPGWSCAWSSGTRSSTCAACSGAWA